MISQNSNERKFTKTQQKRISLSLWLKSKTQLKW